MHVLLIFPKELKYIQCQNGVLRFQKRKLIKYLICTSNINSRVEFNCKVYYQSVASIHVYVIICNEISPWSFFFIYFFFFTTDIKIQWIPDYPIVTEPSNEIFRGVDLMNVSQKLSSDNRGLTVHYRLSVVNCCLLFECTLMIFFKLFL